jgi:hypothetical protein
MTLANQTAEVPRKKIPQKMWEQIRDAEDRAKLTGHSIRQEIISVGQTHGFTETEMQKRGLITARANRKPETEIISGQSTP